LRPAGSPDRDRPLACCPDRREVAFDSDVVESERKVQAHLLGSGVLRGRKLLTPYDGLELGLHDGGPAGVLAHDAGPSLPPGFPGRSRSCDHLGEHLLGGELVPVGASRMLADGGDKLAELVIASDPELNPAGAAADVPG
jgi:hypothetical protein